MYGSKILNGANLPAPPGIQRNFAPIVIQDYEADGHTISRNVLASK
jgi:hypothetical protein